MLIAKSWFSSSEDKTDYKETHLRLWPWPSFVIKKHTFRKENKFFNYYGVKELLHINTKDIFLGKYHEVIQTTNTRQLNHHYLSDARVFVCKQAVLKGKRQRGLSECKISGYVLVAFFPTIDPEHISTANEVIQKLHLKKNECGDAYVPTDTGFISNKDFTALIDSRLIIS